MKYRFILYIALAAYALFVAYDFGKTKCAVSYAKTDTAVAIETLAGHVDANTQRAKVKHENNNRDVCELHYAGCATGWVRDRENCPRSCPPAL